MVQMDNYYAFGLTFNSYQRERSVENKIKFQGQEHIDDLGLNWDSFKWRNHQPDIGRFFNIDPLASDYVYNSAYAFSENHVTTHIELEGLEKVYIFDKPERPKDNGKPGSTYTAEIYVVSKDGQVNGPYRGSSYPNSRSSTDNSTRHNTLSEGEHKYNYESGHAGSSEQGLNIDDSETGQRTTTGTSSSGEEVEMQYVNAHAGQSDNGGPRSRGSTGCITCKPGDAPAFFQNFEWNGTKTVVQPAGTKKTYTGTTGQSSGTIHVYRGGANGEKARQNLVNKQQRDSRNLSAPVSDELDGSPY